MWRRYCDQINVINYDIFFLNLEEKTTHSSGKNNSFENISNDKKKCFAILPDLPEAVLFDFLYGVVNKTKLRKVLFVNYMKRED